MNFKLKLMMGMLMLSSVILLGRCGDEDGTISVDSIQKSFKKEDSSQKSSKDSGQKSSKDSGQKSSKDSKGTKYEVVDLSKKLKPAELPKGGMSGVKFGGYAVAIGKVEEKPTIWISKNKVPREWQVLSGLSIQNPHIRILPKSLYKSFPSQLTKIFSDGKKLKVFDEDGDIWTSSNNGMNWEMTKFAGGSGTIGDPYQIANARHLWLVREHLTSHFQLIQDIDLSVVTESEGFKPIGMSGGSFETNFGFLGTFDGNGKVIRNLMINQQRRGGRSVGLFRAIHRGAILKNMKLENVDVTGKNYIGGLVGWNLKGMIQDSYATGKVKAIIEIGGGGRYIFSGDKVGGLVGVNTGTIKNSYAAVEVRGNATIGGLVGENYEDGKIENSYATGNVSGNDRVGGLVGVIYNGLKNIPGLIKNSYAAGKVRAHWFFGDLVGINGLESNGVSHFVAKIHNSYGKEAKELKTSTGPAGWSSAIWKFEAGEYPKLAWQSE